MRELDLSFELILIETVLVNLFNYVSTKKVRGSLTALPAYLPHLVLSYTMNNATYTMPTNVTKYIECLNVSHDTI